MNDPASSSFTLPAEPKNSVVTGFSQTITTRGGAYVFFPSITGLRYLAALPTTASAPGAVPAVADGINDGTQRR